jgi:endonuclease/exonuclease/phosphatase (EEP) superfamily protein YafD
MGSLSTTPWSKSLSKVETVARMGYRGKIVPSWPSSFPWVLRVPVDQIYSHPGILVTNIKLKSAAGSDHKALTARVGFISKK